MSKRKSALPPISAPILSNPAMAHGGALGFGELIRARRVELRLTLREVAARIATSKPYVAHLEKGNRHPSEKVVAKLAEVLGLDNRELFLLANPQARALVSAGPYGAERLIWEDFRRDEALQRLHNITNEEMEVLSRVALMGEVHSSHDLIYVLNAIRHAIGK